MSDVAEAVVAEVKVPKKMTLKETHGEGKSCTFRAAFAHGAEHTFELTPDHPLYHDFAVHGARQKLSDAGSTKKTSQEAESAVSGLIDALEGGEWSVRGTGGGSSPTGGLLAQALANLYGKDLAEVQTYLAGLHEDEKERAKIHNVLRGDDAVAAEIERIRPPKRVKKVSETAAAAAAQALAGLKG